MNHLMRSKPGCPTALLAAMTHGTAAPSAQGVCAVTTPSLDSTGASNRNRCQFEASFPAEPAAVSSVRRRLRARLEEDGLEGVVDDVVLICTELMANAILHGCLGGLPETILKVTVVWSDAQLRMDVRDPSNVRPQKRKFCASRTTGRGLRLVDELSDRWGVETDPSGRGKTVWTELDSPRQRAAS